MQAALRSQQMISDVSHFQHLTPETLRRKYKNQKAGQDTNQ